MLPDLFLAYYADPFSLDDPIFAVKQNGVDTPRFVSASELQDTQGRIFTFQAARLIDALRLRSLPFIELIDVRHALQLASGMSKKNYEASSWAFSKWLKLTRLLPSERERYLALIDGEIVRPEENVLAPLLLDVCVAMEDVWRGISEELGQLGELIRFTTVEIPLQHLLHKRQWLGLAVDTNRSERFLQVAKNEKYSSMLKVGTQLNVNPTGLTYKTILPYLENTDAHGLQKLSETKGLASYFKITADHSGVARGFRSMLQANRNIKALLSLAVSDGRAYPTFDTMGTVTARVQLSHPYLQQLKRAYRGALTPDSGMHASYLDYAQFEPGILAQFVGPGRFRELYNSGDVYTALSKAVFGDDHKRTVAKQIFIAFCYGMELSSIG
ncbi:MAG: DNA polymerase, partial [Janthinobacterium lividum]